MRIKFAMSVVAAAWCYQPGEVHDVEERAARQYVEQGYAVPADEPDAPAGTASDERATRERLLAKAARR